MVSISNARDVEAFFIEISMLPIQALSIRMWATMFPPSSATAIFIGCPISLALFSAALITRRASSSFTADIDSSLQLFQHVVRRPEARELVQQVTVRPNLICHVAVGVYREEKIDNVIGQRPAIVRKARRLVPMIGKNIWQQLSCDGLCVLRRKAACNGLPPLCAWTQPSPVLSTVRAQIPTSLLRRAESGSSSTMLQTFLFLKKS